MSHQSSVGGPSAAHGHGADRPVWLGVIVRKWSDGKGFVVALGAMAFPLGLVCVFVVSDEERSRLSMPPDLLGGVLLALGLCLCLYALRMK